MKLRATFVALLVLAFIPSLSAGEIASFVNLGFSEDSQTFMFGMYGIEEKTATPWAEAYIVDVPHNKFSENGVGSFTGTKAIGIGQDGSGALYSLVRTMSSAIISAKIDHTNSGRLVYVLLNGAINQESIVFRDFNTGNAYNVKLTQQTRPAQGEKEMVESSFSLCIQTTDNSGKIKTFNVGKPNYFRKGITHYAIRQILLSPDEKNIVFIIEKKLGQSGSFTSSYMVETVKIF